MVDGTIDPHSRGQNLVIGTIHGQSGEILNFGSQSAIILGFVTGNPRVWGISEEIILLPSLVRSKRALGHDKWTSIGRVMVKKNLKKNSSKCGL